MDQTSGEHGLGSSTFRSRSAHGIQVAVVLKQGWDRVTEIAKLAEVVAAPIH
jgi:hypothetical protein